MSDDLRAACEQWLTDQAWERYAEIPSYFTDALLRFAQLQRKAGIKDVIDHCEENIKPLPSGSVVRAVYMTVADWCDARAQAVSQGDGEKT